MPTKVLFLTLRTFSLTGGIEKVCRTISRVLFDLSETDDIISNVYCMYDRDTDRDSRYLRRQQFKGFSSNRKRFVWKSMLTGLRSDVIVLSHIHLLNIGYLIKKISPSKRVYLLAHGIEVWRKLPDNKLKRLKSIDKIICVSQFTADKIHDLHQIPNIKLSVLNNCLDPFFYIAKTFEKPKKLLERYQVSKDHQIIFSLSRLSSSEKYKGYDHTIQVLARLIKDFPNIRYLLGGKWDKMEKQRLDILIEQHGLSKHVKLIGFVDEGELTEHFLLSDLFILPSKKEGFGIVFIEALASGLRVIAGNKDGSVDALRNGTLGVLVDPDDPQILLKEIFGLLTHHQTALEKLDLQKKCLQAFDYNGYLKSIKNLLLEEAIL